MSLLLTLYSLILCHDSHCSVIQDGETALDHARGGKTIHARNEDDKSRFDEVIKYLEEFGK